MDDIYPHYETDTVQKTIFPTLDFLQDTVSKATYSPRGNTVAELVLKDVANLPSVVADSVEADDAVGKGIGRAPPHVCGLSADQRSIPDHEEC